MDTKERGVMVGNARSSGYDRVANDWYVEPARAVTALLKAEAFIGGKVWDPACGGGNIPEVCKSHGLNAIGTDIVDRGYDGLLGTMDFLCADRPDGAFHVVTNPPFALAEEFVQRALHLVGGKVAVLVRAAFLEGQGRYERLFGPTPPANIWQFSPRISMPPGGSGVVAKGGSVAFAWVVWNRAHVGMPRFGWLP